MHGAAVAAWCLGALAAVGDAQDCSGCGTTWGEGIGPPPTGCCGPCPGTVCGGGGGIDYSVPGLKLAPRRGTTGDTNDGNVVFGPFENGFSAVQTSQFFGCTNNLVLAGGIDTHEAEQMVHAQAALGLCSVGNSILNDCGGHANPFHYHERFTCLYSTDAATQHSTRAATMLDDKGLYGKWEDEANAMLPELDACGGHFGVTPDSNGVIVYHYHVQERAPFSAGCFGPAIDPDGDEVMVTIATCRAFHSDLCDGADTISLTSYSGTCAAGAGNCPANDVFTIASYDPDCPCFDGARSNTGTVPLPFEAEQRSTTPSPTPSPTPPSSDELWEEVLALDGVNWAYRARDSKADAAGTSASSGDAVVSISAVGNDIPSVNELAYGGADHSSMQLYYAGLGASPTFVDRGGGDQYIRFINGPASNFETNPGQLSPREALGVDFHLVHLFRAMPGARYEGSITGGISWKDRAGDGQQVQFFAPGAGAALGPSGAVAAMGMDNTVDIRLFAATGIAEFRMNGDLLITTAYSNTTGVPEFVLGTNAHVMANHFRAVLMNRGAHFTETELASIWAKTGRLWPRGELPNFPYLSDAHTNRATTFDRDQQGGIWSPVVSGFSGGNGVEGNHLFQWYYWDQTDFGTSAGFTFTENNPLRSHLVIPGATGASLSRSAHPDVFVRPGDGSVRVMRVVTPRDGDGLEGEALAGEWAYDNIPCTGCTWPPTPTPTPSPTACPELSYCRGVRAYWGTERP